MMEVDVLGEYCDRLLACANFKDACPNGLQVEGDRPVRCLISGVTASQALIDAAVSSNADGILVHHGYFWKNEPPCLVGMKGRRIRTLMRSGISLLAYHLPLDAHPVLGNNRQLALALGICDAVPAGSAEGLLWQGQLPKPMMAADFVQWTTRALGRTPTHVEAHQRPIQSLAWCTGAAQSSIEEAANLGVDAFLSGEISEQTMHQARELSVDYFAAGHHATERYGVQALGTHLAEHFGFKHRFLDLDNPA